MTNRKPNPLASLVTLLTLCCTAVFALPSAPAPPGRTTGFEELKAGPLTTITDRVGRWTSNGKDAEIHNAHRHSGRQCLRINGGKARTCELEIARGYRDAHQLRFWAERWTRRTPFEFRIHALAEGTWQQVYNGDKRIKIGGFLTKVQVDLPEKTEKLRFICTSPEKSGIMIDDLKLSQPTPMAVHEAGVHWLQTPVLLGQPANPLAQIRITTSGSLEPLTVKELTIATAGTTALADIDRLEIFYAGTERELNHRDPKRMFEGMTPFGTPQADDEVQTVNGEQVLEDGQNVLWITATLNNNADQSHRVAATCTRIVLGDGTIIKPAPAGTPVRKRIGVALRNGGDDDVPAYRIPGLDTTNSGVLIAVYDVRRNGWGDLPGHIDVGMSRSTDGGHSWEPMKVIMDMGDDPEWQYDGIGDPAVLVDRVANTIWVAATWSHGNRSWNGSQPGLAPEETGQLMLVSSKDDGRTWSEPINITSQIKDPAWCFLLQGPGRGITMGNGTMVFPAQYQDPPDRKRLPHSTIIYSRDHGKTWEIGTGAFDDTTESAVAELPDGSLMLSCRYNRQNRRVVAITHDLGKTWTEHPTSRLSVPEPGACQASLLSVNRELRKDVGCWLLMSNPNVGDRPRRSMTIKASYDDGMTWPQSQQVLLDEGASAGYSALSMIDDKTVGILYEGSLSHLTFQRVPLADLLGAGKPKPGGTSDKLPVFILTGQSNSLGTTADPKEKDISPGSHAADAERRFFWSNRSTRAGDGPAALYGSSEGEIVPLKVQQGEGKHPYFWGPEFGFSRALHDSDLRNFLVVKASRGGGGNSFWLKGTGNDQMYTHIVKTVKEAIAALPEGVDYEIAALLYLQGESDSPAEARVAGERLGALITNLRTDLPHANRMCAVIAGIGAAGANDHTVREQQRTLAANDPSISYFDNTDLQAGLYDRLHFNKPAKLIIGRRFAHAYLRLAHPESALP